MRLTSFLDNGSLTVVLTGEIDHHCAKALIQGLTEKYPLFLEHTLTFQQLTFQSCQTEQVI